MRLSSVDTDEVVAIGMLELLHKRDLLEQLHRHLGPSS